MPSRRRPKTPSQRALNFGEPFDDTDLNEQWVERGNIVSVNPPTCTCDVETETRGRFDGLPFPYLIQDPEGGGGQIYVPRPGQQVVVQQGIGYPFITQILPFSTDINADAGAAALMTSTENSGAAVFSAASAANFAARLPKDLLPGDFMWRGNHGQYLGLLDGGVGVLCASPWSQIIVSQEDDTTNVIGRNLNVVTGFGNIRFTDEGGKSGFIFEGGTDQTTESGYGQSNWTVQTRIGEESEGLVDFRINNREGEALVKTVWKTDGSIVQFANGNQQSTLGGSAGYAYRKGRTVSVGGGDILEVAGDREELFYGNQTTTVSQNRAANILNDCTHQVNRDWIMNIGRTHTLKVSGDPLATPGSVAADWMISNGSWVVDVGFPGSDFGAAMSSIQFNTYMPNGNIGFSSPAGKIILDTLLPESVLLGSKSGVAPFHAVLWEPLKAFLEQLINWAQNHVHPTGVGPSGPAVVPFPAQSVLNPLLPFIQSQVALIGS